jgi:predicted ATPase
MGAGAEYIAEIVSSVRDLLPGLGKPANLEAGQARFRLFDSITSFLKNAARSQPIMLVLENLHWADSSSMLLLQFVARELSGSHLLLVGTHRDTELSQRQPLAECLDALDRQRLLNRVVLGVHTQNDVVRFIEMTAGLSPPWELVQAVHAQTEGNPLFITEVARMLVQEGQLSGSSSAKRDVWTAHIPEDVRGVIGRRLDRLSQECKELLRIASISGREFEPSLMVPLTEDTSENRLREAQQEAMAALVIEEMPRGRYQFSHASPAGSIDPQDRTPSAGLGPSVFLPSGDYLQNWLSNRQASA